MTGWWRIALTAFLVLLVSARSAVAEVALPGLSRPVNDTTGTLSSAEIQSLEATILALEREKGSQIAVLIIGTTAPETIEQFGIRLAEAWKLGRTKVDDGVILIVAKDDRAVRIEVGYGLEGAIPDAIAKRIVEERIIPQFRAGSIFSGVRDGVDALGMIIRGEDLPPPSPTDDQFVDNEGLFIFLVSGGIFLCAALAAKFGRVGGTLLGSALMGTVSILLLGVFGAIVITILLLFIGLAPHGPGGSRRGRGVRWSSGGGGGFSGGGFRGGGGGFGGGGASGRW